MFGLPFVKGRIIAPVPFRDLLPHGDDCLFSSRAWGRVLGRGYGIDVAYLARGCGGEVPYARLTGVGGARTSALPFADYLPLDDVDEARSVLAQLGEIDPAAELTLKTALPEAARATLGVVVSREAVLHIIPPDGKPHPRFGANVRRAQRDGVTVVRRGDRDALATFYALFADLRAEKFGSIPQPLSFFEAVYEEFVAADRGYFLEALYGGRVIASFFILEAGTRAYYKFSASSLDELVPRPNNLLFDYLLTRLAAGEYSAIDLGLSGAGEAYRGLRYFKSTTGATELPLTYLTVTPDGYDPTARAALLTRLAAVTKAMTEAGLTHAQLSTLSEAVYVEFA